MGKAPVIPVVTRWNSLYDALAWMLPHLKDSAKKSTLDRLFDSLNLVPLSQNEVTIIDEYVTVLRPIALGIDFLQGDKNTFMGSLVPGIEAVLRLYDQLQVKLVYLQDLAKSLAGATRNRFQHVLNSDDHKLAAAFLPKQRMRWVKSHEPAATSQLRALMIRTLKKILDKEPSVRESYDAASTSGKARGEEDMLMDIFAAPNPDQAAAGPSLDVEQCVDAYLGAPDESTAYTHIKQSPILKHAFLKYNTALPSSASVERLFSAGKDVLRPKRACMSDKHFDMIMFLRCKP